MENQKVFVMRVDDDLMSDSDAEDGIEDRSLVAATRFDCNDIFLRYCIQITYIVHVFVLVFVDYVY